MNKVRINYPSVFLSEAVHLTTILRCCQISAGTVSSFMRLPRWVRFSPCFQRSSSLSFPPLLLCPNTLLIVMKALTTGFLLSLDSDLFPHNWYCWGELHWEIMKERFWFSHWRHGISQGGNRMLIHTSEPLSTYLLVDINSWLAMNSL